MPTRTQADIAQQWLLSAVDRAFDLAEQTLAAQRQFALALAGAATRQADIAVDTVVETLDAPVEAAATAVEALERTVEEGARQLEDEAQRAQERPEPPRPDSTETPADASPKQDRKFDGRTYEERTVEELRERAGALQIEGRSSMTKEELIAALRGHRSSRSARSDANRSDASTTQPPKQERTPDRRSYGERSVEELRERARELEIEGRSSMSKDELIAALRNSSR